MAKATKETVTTVRLELSEAEAKALGAVLSNTYQSLLEASGLVDLEASGLVDLEGALSEAIGMQSDARFELARDGQAKV